ncbi:hypothetical protein ACIA74_13970 [Streptomyces sp. NPDC051658]|uniref:hypothetical protein n=1 Tax=Streptomyces sp. NPDC051658 TaxID=3365667 RepID=UPI0037A0367B
MTTQTAPAWWPAALRGVRCRRAFTGLLLDHAAIAYDGQLHVHFADRRAYDAYQSSGSHHVLDAAVQSVLGEASDINYTCDA